MPRLDSPGATRDRIGRIDGGQVDIREGSDPVEEWSAVRCRLRKDSGDPDPTRALT
jgi:hypothetical protein